MYSYKYKVWGGFLVTWCMHTAYSFPAQSTYMYHVHSHVCK